MRSLCTATKSSPRSPQLEKACTQQQRHSQKIKINLFKKRKKGLQTINAGEGGEKRGLSYTAGGNVNWCSHYGIQWGGSSKKLKIELPYDPAIPLLGIYPDKAIICKDTCTPIFIAALFTIAKTWKKPKCP